MKPTPFLIAILLLVCGPLHAGEACTWSEALLALERGNQVRGIALMRMAAGDGDRRAIVWLQQRDGRNSLAANGDSGILYSGVRRPSGR